MKQHSVRSKAAESAATGCGMSFPNSRAWVTEGSRYYAIKDINETTEYLLDQQLGTWMTMICKALLEQPINDARTIFGSPDDLKLRSCLTPFDAVPATFPVFSQVLDKFSAVNAIREQWNY
ncbi:Protein of unknown function [Mucilaginibacter pineti]|uniref:Uncharacterized protein n=1 Tax=Mucilaginibacter pineti TaxID=1391627 RepID=A0A1G7HAI7_9SPHI|nr:Protein of unknown function [Mucilaginibacter pineti]